jgi:hypothetical protein
MTPLPDSQPNTLSHSESYERCLEELRRPQPDYQRAQLCATLSLEEAIRDLAVQLAQLSTTLHVALKRL